MVTPVYTARNNARHRLVSALGLRLRAQNIPAATRLLLIIFFFGAVTFIGGCAGTASSQTKAVGTTNPPSNPDTFSLSGTINPNTGGSGSTVSLSGPTAATTTANSAGSYTFTGLANGAYTVTPSHTGFTFTPITQSAAVNGSSISGLDFTAKAVVGPAFSISGTLTPAAGGGGAAVILSGASAATTTASGSGAYNFSGLPPGTYAVTASNPGYTFSPASRNLTIGSANISNVNFSAEAVQAPHSVALSWNASPSTVSGYNVYRSTVSGSQYAKLNAILVSGLNYSDSTVQNGTTYYYVTTAVDASSKESTFSSQASAIVP
jgi:hypothetical protein